MADRYKDDFFDKAEASDIDKAFLRGQLSIIDDVIGLPAFIKAFRELPSSK